MVQFEPVIGFFGLKIGTNWYSMILSKYLPSQIGMCNKGQLISECPFGIKTSSKKPTVLFLYFCPEIFCTFLGASWKLF